MKSQRVELFISAFIECEKREFKIGDRNVNGFCEMIQLYLNNWSHGIPVSKTAINVIEHPIIEKYRPVPLSDSPQGIQYWFWRGDWTKRKEIAKSIINEYKQ